ncbi:MAG: DUF951 domain-containing protein [Clostridia bacterium]|nr:DUF951 domain-containing protein [Clostridia bacterium]MBR0206348.1 DUF951 domain-containing protein [Clostridia bacterium]
MIDTFALNDRVILKKPHACGENLWEIVRVGADVKLKCVACGRIIMLDRLEFLKRAKKLAPSGKDEIC